MASTVVAGEPGTGGAAGRGNASVTAAGWTAWPQTFIAGTAIVPSPAGPLYAAIGVGNLRTLVDTLQASGWLESGRAA